MKNFFKKEKNFKKEEENLWSHLNLFWTLAVLLMLAGAILSFYFGYYLFTKINTESATSSDRANSQIQTVKKEAIDKELEYFSGREKKSAEIINSPAPIIDPSL